jgi:uroporphyrinogen-III decarboxylase
LNSRVRISAAIKGRLESDFPVVIPYMSIFLRDHWEQITDEPWWLVERQTELDFVSKLMVEDDLQKKLDLDWIQCGLCPSREWRENNSIEVLGDKIFFVDAEKGKKTEIMNQPPGGVHKPRDKELVKSIDDIDARVKVVDAKILVEEGRLDYIKMVVEKFGSEKLICASINSPFWGSTSFFGVTKTYTNLYRKPELIEALCRRLTESSIEILKAYSKMGVDIVWFEECLASSNEISLSHFNRFCLPYNVELLSEINRLGMKSVYYPCGDVRDRLELMIEAGPDGISLEESKKGFEIDLAWVNEVVEGRLCIFGNLDSIGVLQNGTREELRREIRRQVGIGREYGRFVMSLGSPVTPRTSASRVREYVDLVRTESSLNI